LLVAGCWLLVAGYWLLVSHFTVLIHGIQRIQIVIGCSLLSALIKEGEKNIILCHFQKKHFQKKSLYAAFKNENKVKTK
jgi:uncharacterized membrane protein YccF (DUF307 family)